jgi:hypothetical protein
VRIDRLGDCPPWSRVLDIALEVFAMNHHLTLDAAAAATGQSPDRLRTWCATGKLSCEMDGDTWIIPIAEVVRIATLVVEREAAISGGHAEALVVPLANASPGLAAEVAVRLGLTLAAVKTRTLALDGAEYMLAVWKLERPPGPHELQPLVELAEELGGQLLDGEVKRA